MAEWSKAAVLKTAVLVRVPEVRILFPPQSVGYEYRRTRLNAAGGQSVALASVQIGPVSAKFVSACVLGRWQMAAFRNGLCNRFLYPTWAPTAVLIVISYQPIAR